MFQYKILSSYVLILLIHHSSLSLPPLKTINIIYYIIYFFFWSLGKIIYRIYIIGLKGKIRKNESKWKWKAWKAETQLSNVRGGKIIECWFFAFQAFQNIKRENKKKIKVNEKVSEVSVYERDEKL